MVQVISVCITSTTFWVSRKNTFHALSSKAMPSPQMSTITSDMTAAISAVMSGFQPTHTQPMIMITYIGTMW